MTQTQVVDELDALEPLVSASDWHTCDAFLERWIDLAGRNHTRLWDRLELCTWLIRPTDHSSFRLTLSKDTGYPLKIIEKNDTEIMEARRSP